MCQHTLIHYLVSCEWLHFCNEYRFVLDTYVSVAMVYHEHVGFSGNKVSPAKSLVSSCQHSVSPLLWKPTDYRSLFFEIILLKCYKPLKYYFKSPFDYSASNLSFMRGIAKGIFPSMLVTWLFPLTTFL